MGKVLWKTGRYRERRFHAEQEGVADYGAYYAAKTMVDETGKRILWGWIPETRPEAEYRAAGWAGLMALPRTLSLAADGSLETSVAPVVETLRTDHTRVGDSADRQEKKRALAGIRIRGLAGELRAEFEAQRAFQLRLRSEKGTPYAEIAYDPQRGELRANATAGVLRTEGPVSLRVFVDGSALEVCANHRAAITARVYEAPHVPLLVEVSEMEALRSLDVWQMKPISKDRLTT
jgi:beta-fructofuranosidase